VNLQNFTVFQDKRRVGGSPPGQNKTKKMPRKTWSRHRQLHTVCQISASLVVFVLGELPTWINVCFFNFVMWHRHCSTFSGSAQIILFSLLSKFSEKNYTECQKFNQRGQIQTHPRIEAFHQLNQKHSKKLILIIWHINAEPKKVLQ
jgi:hypothetical protein